MTTKAEMRFVPTATYNKFRSFNANSKVFFVSLTFRIKFLMSAKLNPESVTSNNNKAN